LIYQSLLEKSKQLQKETIKWETSLITDDDFTLPSEDIRILQAEVCQEIVYQRVNMRERANGRTL